MENDETLKQALKLYIDGKKQYNTDKQNAKKLFIQSIEILKNIKDSNYAQLIQTTEAECMKYIKNTNIFELIRMNDIMTIKKLENINFREINEYGNTILHHAIEIGDMGILKELLKKGGMIDTVNGNGNTLLEYACLKKDPNIIAFIVQHGGNMAKHLFFRNGDMKFYLNKSDIDSGILLKIIIINSINKTEYKTFSFLENYFNTSELIGLDKYTIKDLMIGLHSLFNGKESYISYKRILLEELDEYEKHKDVNKCIHNRIDIILMNMVPFINYPYNVSTIFILKNEIKYLIKNILKYNKKDFKNILMSKLFETYIETNLFTQDFIGIIIYNILSKIKL